MAAGIIRLADAKDRGTKIIEFDLVGDDGNPVVPKTVKWTLADGNGAIVNSRENINISPLASTLAITLSGADLAAGTTKETKTRILVVKATYDSVYGDDLPIHDAARFNIIDFPQT